MKLSPPVILLDPWVDLKSSKKDERIVKYASNSFWEKAVDVRQKVLRSWGLFYTALA